MKRLILTAMLIVVVGGASIAQAQAPVAGTYKSTNGDFLEGRSATSWVGAGMARLDMGNVLNIESWDGAGLASEWDMCGMFIVNVQLIADLVFGGNGQRIYLIIYGGGTVSLDGGGIWGGGDPVYNGIVDSFVETRTIQIANNIVVGANSNHSVSAHILNYPAGCVAFAIGNGVLIGDTDPTSLVFGVKPATYPGFVDANCAPAGTDGRWGDVTDLTLTIQGCAVPVEEKSWGGVKALYTD